jgi:hypothetical protein
MVGGQEWYKLRGKGEDLMPKLGEYGLKRALPLALAVAFAAACEVGDGGDGMTGSASGLRRIPRHF